MSAALRIIEGTWDEVLTHAHELAGHRLRVTVIGEATTPSTLLNSDSSLAARQAWADDLDKWIGSLPPLGPWDDSRETLYGDISE
jgi:hypothetical protein